MLFNISLSTKKKTTKATTSTKVEIPPEKNGGNIVHPLNS